MIQDLLRRHPRLSATRADLQSTGLVAVIALREIPGAHQNHVAVVGEFHMFNRKQRRTGTLVTSI